MVTFLFLFICGKVFKVTVIDGEFLRAKAIDQWTRELPIKAKRGDIVDRNGVLLAGSKGTYSVFVRPRCVTNVEQVVTVLSSLYNCDKDKLRNKITKNATSEIKVAGELQKSEVIRLLDYQMDGVYYSIDNTRVYPYKSALCQTIGYLSSDGVGQSGLEKYYDEYLLGQNGEIVYESDLTGSDLSSKATYLPAQNGYNLQLTIDYEIQLICENHLASAIEEYSPKSAQIIVLEPNSGRVLALAQQPSFDLNDLPRDDLDTLLKLSRNSLILDSYEPGSTFKVITASANIEEYNKGNSKAFSPEHIFNSSRYRIVSGRKIKCWTTHANGKHANENLAMALNNSCNPIFVDIALSLGKCTMYEYVNKFNFGKATGIDFQGEAIGMVIPESAVTDGDLARIGFGQTIAVTPIQLASAVCACINGGKYYQPYLVEQIYTQSQTVIKNYPAMKNRVISEKTSEYIRSCLEDVVSVGSGKQAFIEGYRVGGKTGTAQKYNDGVIAVGKYVMSFVGFFPADNPQYLALVIVDEPVGGQYGSTVAAPICKKVFSDIIQSKNIKKSV